MGASIRTLSKFYHKGQMIRDWVIRDQWMASMGAGVLEQPGLWSLKKALLILAFSAKRPRSAGVALLAVNSVIFLGRGAGKMGKMRE